MKTTIRDRIRYHCNECDVAMAMRGWNAVARRLWHCFWFNLLVQILVRRHAQ